MVDRLLVYHDSPCEETLCYISLCIKSDFLLGPEEPVFEGPKQECLVPNNLAYMGQSPRHSLLSLLSQLIPRLKFLSYC